jgi:hypothetical protein
LKKQQILKVYSATEPGSKFQLQKHLFLSDEQFNTHHHANPFVHGDTILHMETHDPVYDGAALYDYSSQHILAQSTDQKTSQATDMTLAHNVSAGIPYEDGKQPTALHTI